MLYSRYNRHVRYVQHNFSQLQYKMAKIPTDDLYATSSYLYNSRGQQTGMLHWIIVGASK